MNPCEQFESQLFQFRDNLLPAAARADLERHLRDCARCRRALDAAGSMERDLRESLAALRPDARFENETSARLAAAPSSRKFLMIAGAVGLAAAALLAFNVYQRKGATPETPASKRTLDGVASIERINVSDVFAEAGDGYAALLEDTYTGREQIGRAGDTVLDLTIHAVEADAVTFIDDGRGAHVTMPVHPQTDADRSADVAGLAAAFARGDLADFEFDRLLAHAYHGNVAARDLLETLAAAPGSPWAARAAGATRGRRKNVALETFLKRAADPNDPYRVTAIEGLRRVDTPEARALLRRIAMTPDDPQSITALHALGSVNDTASLGALRAMLDDASLPAARRYAAQAAYDAILGATDAAKEN